MPYLPAITPSPNHDQADFVNTLVGLARLAINHAELEFGVIRARMKDASRAKARRRELQIGVLMQLFARRLP
jgi:hypothetical protein